MRKLGLLLLTVWAVGLHAQSLPTMKRIEGSTARMGGGYQFAIKDYYMVLLGDDAQYAALNKGQTVIGEVPAENNPTRQVTIATFHLAETEVTTQQYRDFLVDSLLSPAEQRTLRAQLKNLDTHSAGKFKQAWQPLLQKASAAALLPDTSCWVTDFVFSYNEPLVKNYLWHPAFDQYPVVGVSWEQAQAYCEWLTRITNKSRAAKNLPLLPSYRLPTEMEWEFAAREFVEQDGQLPRSYNYPWKSNSVMDDKGQFRANIKTGHQDYIGDNYEYTAPVKAFAPNSKGLYQMGGNVSEWCLDVFRLSASAEQPHVDYQKGYRPFEAAPIALQVEERVVKGGSWAEMQYAAMPGSRMGWSQARGGSRIGFRVAQSQIGCECKNAKKCPHNKEL